MEKMAEFFEKRIGEYDSHMMTEVAGCCEGYRKMAELLRPDTKTLLDLGCGTGLELDEIYRRFPDIQVVGVDLTQAMLDRLKQKHPDKRLTLICADYFQAELGEGQFDAAVSFETMHHFAHAPKRALYHKIYTALKADGVYLECDYMVETQEEEDALFAESDRLYREFTAEPDTFYHIDTPCTVENQIHLLQEAGFSSVKLMFRLENTTLLLAKK